MNNGSTNASWFTDFQNPNFGCVFRIKRCIVDTQTKYQKVGIYDTGEEGFGICLVLDGKMQSSAKDEFIYHEALVHPALLTHPDPKRVFIIGGGEGATLREVLKHPSVESVLMADIDEVLVDLCIDELYPWHQGAFENQKADFIFGDARKHLQENEEQFDVIIIDISEPVEDGPACLLYTKEFYALVKERLTAHGAISLQAGSTVPGNMHCLSAVYQTLKTAFPIVEPYQVCIPSFGFPWGFILAAKENMNTRYLNPNTIDQLIARKIDGPLRFYNGEANTGQFNLPKFVREELEKGKVITDDDLHFTYH